jgi:hypothetical protein
LAGIADGSKEEMEAVETGWAGKVEELKRIWNIAADAGAK